MDLHRTQPLGPPFALRFGRLPDSERGALLDGVPFFPVGVELLVELLAVSLEAATLGGIRLLLRGRQRGSPSPCRLGSLGGLPVALGLPLGVVRLPLRPPLALGAAHGPPPGGGLR